MAAFKKISRKDIAKMSFADFLRASREPYRRLFSYLGPYRSRFALGIVFGALYGAVQGLLVFDVQFVAGAVFSEHKAAKSTAIVKWFPDLAHLDLSHGSMALIHALCASIPGLMRLRRLR